MEMVDIIDESGSVVKIVSKQEAHEKGLLHKTVIGEVIDSRGRFLLTLQASHKQDAGQFVSPMGGHMLSGELEIDGVKREMLEELGFKDFKSKRLGDFVYNREVIGRKENHLFCLYEVYADDDPVLNNESVEFKWFTKEELRNELRNNPKKFGDSFFVVLRNFYPQLLS